MDSQLAVKANAIGEKYGNSFPRMYVNTTEIELKIVYAASAKEASDLQMKTIEAAKIE
ncbi:hypothetical protein [Furfurilactobacillus curtus]|uniref:Uncharacterized protein n=1 Tax=Furfurilactobacillus curtus TaxID=1746200 RepID=A0ABQ5JLB6_9LACO